MTNQQLIRAYIDAEWADYKADDCAIRRLDDQQEIAAAGLKRYAQVGDYRIETDDGVFAELVRVVDGRVVSVWTSCL